MSRFTRSRDAQQAQRNRRKAGKRRKGKTVARHCTRCRSRPAAKGAEMCGRCTLLPSCSALDCRRRVDLAGDVCDPCAAALGLRRELTIDDVAPKRTLF